MTTVANVDDARELVHVAILRTVREGREEEFEAKIAAFFGQAAHEAGVRSAYLIRPIAGSQTREYGILRTFDNNAAMRDFYGSALYARWQSEVRPLVEGEPQKRELHGLEAFFRSSTPPPQWKMAILTWVGVTPAVYLFSKAVPAIVGPLPELAGLMLVNLLVVASLAWVLMPALTRIFRSWLRARAP